MKKVGIAVIHGVGSQTEDSFYDDAKKLRQRIEDCLRKLEADPDLLAWEPIFWAENLELREREYIARTEQAHDLNWEKARRFFVSTLGDAVAYLPVGRGEDATQTYDYVHGVVQRHLRSLAGKLDGGERPLVVLAHSLGSVIMSNYIWDRQHEAGPSAQSAFERLETLTGFVTFGSTLPLFSFAHDPAQPIHFPPQNLRRDLILHARWLNFFDRDDVLGYPLREIGPAYAALEKLEDHQVNVGGVLSSWNPLSHLGYWDDKDFAVPVAKLIAEILPVA